MEVKKGLFKKPLFCYYSFHSGKKFPWKRESYT